MKSNFFLRALALVSMLITIAVAVQPAGPASCLTYYSPDGKPRVARTADVRAASVATARSRDEPTAGVIRPTRLQGNTNCS